MDPLYTPFRVYALVNAAAVQLDAVTSIAAGACRGTSTTGEFPAKTIEVVTHTKYGRDTDTAARMIVTGARQVLCTDLVEDSVAGHQIWDRQLKEEYHQAAATLKDLGLVHGRPTG